MPSPVREKWIEKRLHSRHNPAFPPAPPDSRTPAARTSSFGNVPQTRSPRATPRPRRLRARRGARANGLAAGGRAGNLAAPRDTGDALSRAVTGYSRANEGTDGPREEDGAYYRYEDPAPITPWVRRVITGIELLRNGRYNKGMAFSEEEALQDAPAGLAAAR